VNVLSSSRSQQASKIPEALAKFLVKPNPPRRPPGQANKPCVRSSNARGKTSSLRELALTKEQELWKTKLAHRPKPFWYPYATLRNLPVLERLLARGGRDLLELCRGDYGRIADIGAADGDRVDECLIGLRVGARMTGP